MNEKIVYQFLEPQTKQSIFHVKKKKDCPRVSFLGDFNRFELRVFLLR